MNEKQSRVDEVTEREFVRMAVNLDLKFMGIPFTEWNQTKKNRKFIFI